ncbi:MAG: zinc ribbon domain-containing protein [Oscillospiraceae bacterium]|nr:zinc ribbon domain-containing protein [Oscillospiraceae bacterium]
MTSALSSAVSVTPTPVADAIPSVVLTPLQTPKPVHPAVSETPMPLATLAPKPAATGIPEPAATPAALAAAQSNAPIVLKQPTGEGHFIGESAMFIVDARNYSSLHWNAVSPSGREIDMKTFRETFPDCSVIGEKDTTLLITNLNIDMSGWSFFCTFENADASTSTEKARLRVRDPLSATPAPTGTATTGTDTAVATKTKALRCPACGSEVPRDLLSCPYCGKQIYTQNENAYVTQDPTGDIYYRDNTGTMYYDSTDGTSTFVDNNGNYTIFNENGLVQSGNYNKEDEEAEQLAILESFFAGEDEAEQQAALLAMLGY